MNNGLPVVRSWRRWTSSAVTGTPSRSATSARVSSTSRAGELLHVEPPLDAHVLEPSPQHVLVEWILVVRVMRGVDVAEDSDDEQPLALRLA